MLRAIVWHVLMILWLAGLISGLWWIAPNFTGPAATFDRVASLLWWLLGALAWLVAFNLGRQRYWRSR